MGTFSQGGLVKAQNGNKKISCQREPRHGAADVPDARGRSGPMLHSRGGESVLADRDLSAAIIGFAGFVAFSHGAAAARHGGGVARVAVENRQG
jgi:hypothetical protein